MNVLVLSTNSQHRTVMKEKSTDNETMVLEKAENYNSRVALTTLY